MKYELIFCDFDGTLLRNDFTVGEKSVKAIKDYISRGGNFVICTGRMSRSMDGWLDYLGIRNQRIAVAGFQGTHIADTSGKLLYCDYIDPDSVYKIMELGKRLGVYTHFTIPTGCMWKKKTTSTGNTEGLLPFRLKWWEICAVTLKAIPT